MIPVEICALSVSVQKVIQQLFGKDPRILLDKLFRSRAKGNFKHGSDIDLAIDSPHWQLSDFLAFQMELDDLLLP